MALTILDAAGEQNGYVDTKASGMAFFDPAYRRHTHFTEFTKKLDALSDPALGRETEFLVAKHADLANGVYLELQMPVLRAAFAYANGVAFNAIETVKVKFNTTTVVELTGEYLHRMYVKRRDASKSAATADQLLGLFPSAAPNTPHEYGSQNAALWAFSTTDDGGGRCRRLRLVLPLWTSEDPSQRFPLCSLTRADMKVAVKFKPLTAVVQVVDPVTQTSVPTVDTSIMADGAGFSCTAYGSYTFLTKPEQRAVVGKSADYLVRQHVSLLDMDFTSSSAVEELARQPYRPSNVTEEIAWRLRHRANARARPLDTTVPQGTTPPRHALAMVDYQFIVDGVPRPDFRETARVAHTFDTMGVCAGRQRLTSGEGWFSKSYRLADSYLPTGGYNLSYVSEFKHALSVFNFNRPLYEDCPAVDVAVVVKVTRAADASAPGDDTTGLTAFTSITGALTIGGVSYGNVTIPLAASTVTGAGLAPFVKVSATTVPSLLGDDASLDWVGGAAVSAARAATFRLRLFNFHPAIALTADPVDVSTGANAPNTNIPMTFTYVSAVMGGAAANKVPLGPATGAGAGTFLGDTPGATVTCAVGLTAVNATGAAVTGGNWSAYRQSINVLAVGGGGVVLRFG